MSKAEPDPWSTWAKVVVIPLLLAIFGAFLSPIADDILNHYGMDSQTVSWFAGAMESLLSAPLRFWHVLVIGVLTVLGRYGWRYLRSERSVEETEKNAAADLSGFEAADSNSSAVDTDGKEFEDVKAKGVLWDGTVVEGSVESLSDPQCPRCGTELTTEFDGTAGPGPDRICESYCPNDTCSFTKDWMKPKYRDDVKKVIERRIRDGELEI